MGVLHLITAAAMGNVRTQCSESGAIVYSHIGVITHECELCIRVIQDCTTFNPLTTTVNSLEVILA